MATEEFVRVYHVTGMDFTNAGRASTGIKDTLKRIGMHPAVVRRVAVAVYEAEMNVIIHARRGDLWLRVTPNSVVVDVEDEGPGIPDIGLAMQEGYSTASRELREMGFGAGMGLPNIKRQSDVFEITSDVGRGTRLRIVVNQA